MWRTDRLRGSGTGLRRSSRSCGRWRCSRRKVGRWRRRSAPSALGRGPKADLSRFRYEVTTGGVPPFGFQRFSIIQARSRTRGACRWLQKPSEATLLQTRTELAQFRASETHGQTEKFFGRVGPPGRPRVAPRPLVFLGFSALPAAAENVVLGRVGGGRETGIQPSLRRENWQMVRVKVLYVGILGQARGPQLISRLSQCVDKMLTRQQAKQRATCTCVHQATTRPRLAAAVLVYLRAE